MSKDIDNEIDVVVSKANDDTIIATTTSEKAFQDLMNKAIVEYSTYNVQNKQHIYSRLLQDMNGIGDYALTEKEINELAVDTQDDINKVLKINRKIRYYINRDDLIGKVYEVIENNVNTEVKLNYRDVIKKSKIKEKQKAEELIKNFNDTINLKGLLRKVIPLAYVEGNYIMYRRQVGDSYVVDRFPLGVAEISPYEIDGEPVVLINIPELRGRLVSAGYKDKKGNSLFMRTIEEEIKASYPEEVYLAYKNKEKYAKLNPENVGVVRINNLNRQYGVSPIFRTFLPQTMLDVMSASDKNSAAAKGKKIIVQILRKEIMGENGESFDSGKWMFAHSELMKAWQNPVVVYTGLPWVEDIKYVESKVEQIPVDTINYYKNKVLTALGISFVSPENKNSYVVAQINIDELMKTINKIGEQIEAILGKWYKTLLRDNHIDISNCPTVQVMDSELLEFEIRLKLADMIFNKFGASFKTTYELLNIDYENEKQRREEENENKLDETVFYARQTAYTFTAKGKEDYENTDKTEENQNQDKEKQSNDKARYSNRLSDNNGSQ